MSDYVACCRFRMRLPSYRRVLGQRMLGSLRAAFSSKVRAVQGSSLGPRDLELFDSGFELSDCRRQKDVHKLPARRSVICSCETRDEQLTRTLKSRGQVAPCRSREKSICLKTVGFKKNLKRRRGNSARSEAGMLDPRVFRPSSCNLLKDVQTRNLEVFCLPSPRNQDGPRRTHSRAFGR